MNSDGLKRWWHRFLGLTVLLLFGSFFGDFGWFFDVLAHFRVQYFLIHVVGTLTLVTSKERVLLFSLLLSLVLNGLTIFPVCLSKVEPLPSLGTFSVLEFNLWRVHPQRSLVVDYLSEQKADVLVLVEMTKEWEKDLPSVRTKYPYGLTVPRKDNFGLALWSRLPLTECKIHSFDGEDRPAISALTKVAGHEVFLIVAHPPPPKHPRYFRLRNDYFNRLAGLERPGVRTVVVGDLNTPGWSFYFQGLLKKMKLRDSRQGFGIQPTWPTVFPLLLTPIDHCLISQGLFVRQRRVGPNLWSDHYPLFIQLSLSSLGLNTSTNE